MAATVGVCRSLCTPSGPFINASMEPVFGSPVFCVYTHCLSSLSQSPSFIPSVGTARGQSVPGASPTPRAGPTPRSPAGAEDRPAGLVCAAAEAEFLPTASCHRGSASRPLRSKGLVPRGSCFVSRDDSSFPGSPRASAAGLLTQEAASAGPGLASCLLSLHSSLHEALFEAAPAPCSSVRRVRRGLCPSLMLCL